MNKLFTIASLIIFITQISIAQQYELPAKIDGEQIVEHIAYTFSYNEQHEQPSWVAYQLTKAETNKVVDRSDKFVTDPLVTTGSATANDYKKMGYDRGHLAPAADMSFSHETMQESFYYSNMSPQEGSFNRGKWKNLEALLRSWAIEYDSIYIATAGVLEDDLPTIGANEVSVPNSYYKAVFRFTDDGVEGIGFLMENKKLNQPLQSYAVSIDSLEEVTGIDFFYLLDDNVEDDMESDVCDDCWSWTAKYKGLTSNSSSESSSVSVQCSGVTKSGSRCKNNTSDPSGYCHLHVGQAKGSK